MPFRLFSVGDFKKSNKFLTKATSGDMFNVLDRYGRQGVDALAQMTPQETGLTAGSWEYRVERGRGRTTIYWTNTHEVSGVNIAVIIQYGHGTGTGGYVEGIDYINPAMRSVFQGIADAVWEEVRRG